MGRKKSVVLMTLLTIVIVVLCALVAFPVFPITGTPDSWNPVALQYDLDADLGGGYYAYYYPEGVIPETEYDDQLAALTVARDEAADEDKQDAQEELDEFVDSYVAYKVGDKQTGLYLSTDPELAIVDNGVPTEEFKSAFNAAAREIANRFSQKEYSSIRYAVVDDFSIRVQLPYSEFNASAIMTGLMMTGDMSIVKGEDIVDELKTEGATASDLIKSISVATRYKTAYLKIQFTAKGKEMIKRVKGELSAAPTTSNADTSSLTKLDIKIGDEVITSIYKDSIMDNNREARVFAVDQVNKAYLETFEILFDSILENGDYDVEFRSLAASDVRSFEPVYGENVMTLLFIALAVVMVALLVLPVVTMGKYGVVGTYINLSYFIVTTICFAFISGGIFEVSLGSVLIFLAGLALINVLHYHVYNAIKKEFLSGKTVESAIKGGFNKTLGGMVDIYVVLLLGALALLIGAAGVYTLALQAIICVITAAFCNLLWARAINFVLFSTCKNIKAKYSYFREVWEDEDDE
jgi:hypothetical protein